MNLPAKILLLLCALLIVNSSIAYPWQDSLKKIRNLEERIKYLKQQERTIEEETTEWTKVQIALAMNYTLVARYSQAEDVLIKVEKIIQKEDAATRLRFLTAKAHLHKYQNYNDKALELYVESKMLANNEGIKDQFLIAQINLAEFYRKIANYPKAAEEIKAAEKNYFKSNIGDTSMLIRLYGRAAAIETESGLLKDTSYSYKALKLARLIDDKIGQATSLNEIAFGMKNNNRFERANKLYLQAEEIWRELGDKASMVHTMINRAMSYQSEFFENPKAKELYLEIINIIKSDSIDHSVARPFAYLNELSINEGDTVMAYEYFGHYHNAIVADLYRKYDSEVARITEQYENEKTKNILKRVRTDLVKKNKEVTQRESQNKKQVYYIITLSLLLLGIVVLVFLLRKRNKELSERNTEKDVLIQEIHHRVKNNLQFVSSIMNMQINKSENNREKESLGDASRRIKAMALVHEMLYSHNNTEGIKIKAYMEELRSSLEDLISHKDKKVDFKMEVEDLIFDVPTSVALGMIASEFISNSFKHAFEKVKDPQIRIYLAKKEKRYCFMISDNGPGFDQAKTNGDSLGLRLIDIFSRQIKGSYELSTDKSCSFNIEFKLKK